MGIMIFYNGAQNTSLSGNWDVPVFWDIGVLGLDVARLFGGPATGPESRGGDESCRRADAETCIPGPCPPPGSSERPVIAPKGQPFHVTLAGVGEAAGDGGQRRNSTAAVVRGGAVVGIGGQNVGVYVSGSKKQTKAPVVRVVLGGRRWRLWRCGRGGRVSWGHEGGDRWGTAWTVKSNFSTRSAVSTIRCREK